MMPTAARNNAPPATPAPIPAFAPIDIPCEGELVLLASEWSEVVAVDLLALAVKLAADAYVEGPGLASRSIQTEEVGGSR